MDALRYATTKIQPPRLRSARIARPQLDAALGDALRRRRVVLLLAPAGFGKTCALAAQFERADADDGDDAGGLAPVWVSLDEDDDPQRAFACLAGALEPLDPPWRSAPEALVAQLGEGDAAVRRVVAELVNALAATDVAHGVIVLDDLHRVQHTGVHALLDALIERLPDHWTLALSTRAEPPLALARWRAADELAEFTQQSLRFDAEEARRLAAAEWSSAIAAGGAAGTDTDTGADYAADAQRAAAVDELFERTQGWPAGMRLCLASLRGRPGLATRLAAGRIDHHLFDYLAGEVLDDMPAELHDFLLRCSVLPALTDARCAAVSGDARAADRLDEVERRGLFVTVLDSEQRTLVLHDLFREALDERLRQRLPAELPALLRRAAEGEADPLRRVGFLMRAADHAAAEQALVDASEELMLQGLVGELLRVVEQFPGDWRAASPRLLRLRAACLGQGWDWAGMIDAARGAVAAAQARGEVAEAQIAQGYLAAGLNSIGQHAACMALLDEMRAQAATASGLAPQARVLFLMSECSMLFRRGAHAELPGAYTALLDELERGATLYSWWACAPSSGWMSVRGMRRLIRRYVGAALQRIGDRELAVRADLRMLEAWALQWGGEPEAAGAEATLAAADARWLATSATMEGNLLVFHAIRDAVAGRREPVQRMLEDWLARAAGMSPEAAQAWCHDIAGFAIRMHDVLGSDAAELERWARHLKHGLPDPAQIATQAIWSSAYSVRHAAAQGRWRDAAALYRVLLPVSGTMDSLGQTNELHLRAAHAYWRAGAIDEAADALRSALTRIAAEGERGHALMAGPAVLRALDAVDWGARIEPALRAELAAIAALSARLQDDATRPSDSVPRVADSRDGAPTARPAAASAMSSSASPAAPARDAADTVLSAREREVLQHIAAGDSNKLIARALDISPHTVKRHVGNILDKLALASRGQAAAWLRAHP